MGARLKMLREAAGLSQVRLAELAGVTPRTVQNWEYGKRTFDFESAVQLARALGITLDELAGVGQAEAAPKKKKGK
jgi:transcriptional regulator with XRE-family HTH domain